MPDAFVSAFSLVGTGGAVIIGATVATLVLAVAANLLLVARYSSLERDLADASRGEARFSHGVLERILRDAEQAGARARDIDTQAIVEHRFQTDLKPLLLAERFVRSATGLVIILGLLGTFYGLTLSIGKLVGLVAGEAAAGDVTEVVTKGLTQSLSGMSIAFSNSLFGIGAAVILTLLSVLFNVTDRRTAVMVHIETYLDRRLAGRPSQPAVLPPDVVDGVSIGVGAAGLARIVDDFDGSVAKLEKAVLRFESALQAFATNTRDFKEFNLHLKDNVQRMSLSFADFSEALKSRVVELKSADRS